MKIDERKIEKAFKEFMKNPSLAKYYNNAPSDACKNYIRFEWYDSEYDEFPSVEEYKKARDVYWSKLSVDDLRHIQRYSVGNPFWKICEDRIKELQAKS